MIYYLFYRFGTILYHFVAFPRRKTTYSKCARAAFFPKTLLEYMVLLRGFPLNPKKQVARGPGSYKRGPWGFHCRSFDALCQRHVE